MLRVRHQEHGLEVAQRAVGAPVLGQLHRGAQQVAVELLELGLELLEEAEGVCRGASEASRITSYNVCYTKLLRVDDAGLEDEFVEGFVEEVDRRLDSFLQNRAN